MQKGINSLMDPGGHFSTLTGKMGKGCNLHMSEDNLTSSLEVMGQKESRIIVFLAIKSQDCIDSGM